MKNAITLFCLSIATMSMGQRQSPGYVVAVSMDTLRGIIREGSDAELRQEIWFAKDKDSAFERYLPEQLVAAGFDYGREFKVIISPKNAQASDQRLFAKRIVGGRVHFYTIGSDEYIFSKSDSLNTLVRPPIYRELTDKNGLTYRVKDLNHVLEMERLMSDSPNSLRSIKELPYSYPKLREATVQYNNEFSQDYPVTVYRPRQRYNPRLTIGTALGMEESVKQFQLGLFVEVTKIERSRHISLLSGFVFSSWDSGITNLLAYSGSFPVRQSYLAFYPIGLNVQSSPARLQFYAHIDFGLISFVTTEQATVRYDQYQGNYVATTSTVKESIPLFFNAAIGAKVAIGDHAILLEVGRTFGKMSAGNFVSANVGFVY